MMKRFLGILAILLGLSAQAYAQAHTEALYYTKLAKNSTGLGDRIFYDPANDGKVDSVYSYFAAHNTVAGADVFSVTRVHAEDPSFLAWGPYTSQDNFERPLDVLEAYKTGNVIANASIESGQVQLKAFELRFTKSFSCTDTGRVLLGTTGPTPFLFTFAFVTVTDTAGFTSGATNVTLGYTAPGYNQINGGVDLTLAGDNFTINKPIVVNLSTKNRLVPANTPIYFYLGPGNSGTAAVATSMHCTVDMVGYNW